MDARQAKRPPVLRWLREGDSGDGFAVGFDGQIWPISCVEHLAAGEMVNVWENRGYNLCRPAVLFEPDLDALAEKIAHVTVQEDALGQHWLEIANDDRIAAIRKVLEDYFG